MAMNREACQVWFGDDQQRQLTPREMYLAVYAAGGGKRNMANFVQEAGPSSETNKFRPADVHVNISCDIMPKKSQFYICRFASNRGEWVLKSVPGWCGHPTLKLIPEWFKARFWDNRQEKKHPWFMFILHCESADGHIQYFPSNAFPVHQYYPTGPKKTDPNETGCRTSFYRVLKQAPSTTNLESNDALSSLGPSSGRRRASEPKQESPRVRITSGSDFTCDVYREPRGRRHSDGGAIHNYQDSPRSSMSSSPVASPLSEDASWSDNDSNTTSNTNANTTTTTTTTSTGMVDCTGTLMDCDADRDRTPFNPNRHHGLYTNQNASLRKPLDYNYQYVHVGQQTIKNIGKRGLDAAQTLMALRDCPMR